MFQRCEPIKAREWAVLGQVTSTVEGVVNDLHPMLSVQLDGSLYPVGRCRWKSATTPYRRAPHAGGTKG